MKIVRWVCEKCGFKTEPFDDDNIEEYLIAKKIMEEHCSTNHPKSPRYHNYTHYEFWNELTKSWYR